MMGEGCVKFVTFFAFEDIPEGLFESGGSGCVCETISRYSESHRKV